MAKTYTLTSTSVNAGWRASWSSAAWESYSSAASLTESLRVPYVGKISWNSTYRATNILFDSTTLNTLRGKTVTSIKLTITVVNGTLYANSANYPIGYKLNSSATDWTRSDSASSASSATAYAGHLSTSSKIEASNTSVTVDLGTTVPKYGYVIGLNSSSLNMYIQLATSATLTVVTNESDYTYTLSYNANSGSGAPSSQSQTVTASSAPSMTFTISSTRPSRTGYTFLGWSTSSSASSASYQPSGSITISASTTLYAVWQIITYTVSYNKGSSGTGTNTSDTKTYNVALTLKGAIFTRTGYQQDGWATSDGGSSVYALSASYTANASTTLYPHWKATTSVISANNGTLGTAQTISVTRYNSSYTHTITYKYGNATGTVGTGIGTSVSWTPPLSLASQFPSATSGTCTLTCTTYSGSTALGTSTTSITLSIPYTVKCTVSSVTLAETVSGLNSKFGAYVQNKSKLSVTGSISTSNAYGATISSYSITINGQTLTSNGATTNVLQSSGTNSYSFTIKDTRGRTDTYTGTFNVVAYTAPSVSETAQRDSSTTSSIVINYSWNIAEVGSRNDKSIAIKYRLLGASSYTTETTITPSAYSGSGSYTITGTDTDASYDVLVQATDYFTTASSSSSVSALGNRIFHISHTDQTIGRHGQPPVDGYDHQYFNERFHGVVDITQRRCYATLSSVGWYRVLTYDAVSSASVQGDDAFAIDVTLMDFTRQMHKIALQGLLGALKFVNEISATSVANYDYFDKIRYTQNGTKGYIDVHYVASSTRKVACYFDVKTSVSDYRSRFVANNFTAVADAPSGETVLTTYEFTANGIRTVTITSAHSSVTINNQRCARSGNVVSLWVDFTVSTAISGYDNLINTPTFANNANALVYDSGNVLQTNVRLYADAGNYGLRGYAWFPAGRYIAYVTYITTDN